MATMKEQVIGIILSASLGVASASLITWRQVAVLSAELDQVKVQLMTAQKELADHQEDIKKMYNIDGQLSQVVKEVQGLREDLRQIRK